MLFIVILYFKKRIEKLKRLKLETVTYRDSGYKITSQREDNFGENTNGWRL